MTKPFKFKQFTIQQDKCAMKIGTDGVLLGAWASLNHNPFAVLDIGAGTGILSLILAQRSPAQLIEALEIDADAYEQCADNFENSPWNDRLFCYHASLLEFIEEVEEQYDTIICNPPFYKPTLPSVAFPEGEHLMQKSRQMARFQDAMPFEHLVYGISKLLSKTGVFSVIIPYVEEERFIDLASEVHLFPIRICHVKGTSNSEIKRSLLEFSFYKNDVKLSELIIENQRHQYTEPYIKMVKDFYLKM